MVNKLCATSHVPVNTGGIKCAEATRILFDLGVKLELHVLTVRHSVERANVESLGRS